MASKESSSDSNHHYELLSRAQQENGRPTEVSNSPVNFKELPSIHVDEGNDPASVQSYGQVIATEETATAAEETAKATDETARATEEMSGATAQATAKGNSEDMLLIPPLQDNLMLKRLCVSDNSQSEDNISAAVEQLKSAMQEVERAGKHLQECVVANKAQSEKQVTDCQLKHEVCQAELTEYKEKCARLEECEKKLRQCYEMEINSLEKDVVKLQNEKGEDHTTYATELESLKLQHKEETKDLRHTIKLQAKQCRRLDSELVDLKRDYAGKEKHVADLREELERKQRELKELELVVKKKEKNIEMVKKNIQEESKFTTSEVLKRMLLDKEMFQEKLKTCEGISDLVSRLPHVHCQEERDKITKEVMNKLGRFSRTNSRKKTKSWHSSIS